jgi:hypothetical protein
MSLRNFTITSARKACRATLTVKRKKAGATKDNIFMKLK